LLGAYMRSGGTVIEIVTVSLLFGIPLLLCVGSVILLLKKMNVRLICMVTAITDLLFLTGFLTFLLFRTNAPVDSPFVLSKSIFVFVVLTLVLCSSLPFRSIYPIITGCGGIVILGAYFIFSLIRSSSFTIFAGSPPSETHAAFVTDLVLRSGIILFAVIILSVIIIDIRQEVMKTIQTRVTYAYFARFFPPRVAKRLSKSEPDVALTSHAVPVHAAILNIAIRSFSTLCQNTKPDIILTILAEYFSQISAIIIEHGGTIHSFCGDEIVASFGTLDPSEEDDLSEAIISATSITEAISIMNESLAEKDLPEITVGVGLHYGPVIAATVGTDERKEYTLLGGALSVAKKVQDACTIIDTDILVSKEVVDLLREKYPFSKVGSTVLKETGETIVLYSLKEE
ncbi:MAG TPA: adenylate/guanylate cyclase domain-containing protein, partial [Spirochaetota bacterium]